MQKKNLKIKLLIAFFAAIALLIAGAVLGAHLVMNGVIQLNHPSKAAYPIRGVDVSRYQGDIDWPTLANEGIDFAFIKATEGSSYRDPCFDTNLSEARKTDLRVGAYHFFSFESAGATQAANFIAAMPRFDGSLPPVIDLEYYGSFAAAPPSADQVRAELDAMIALLRDAYGTAPILYVTEDTYERYIAGHYADIPIWIRDVITYPTLSDGRNWTFWQYTNRERLDGYNGQERFIDMNVFYGSEEDFASFGITE